MLRLARAHTEVFLHDHDAHTALVNMVVHHGSGDAHLFPCLVKEGSSALPHLPDES